MNLKRGRFSAGVRRRHRPSSDVHHVRGPIHHPTVVGGDEQGMALAPQLVHPIAEDLDGRVVKPGVRFVQQDNAGVVLAKAGKRPERTATFRACPCERCATASLARWDKLNA